MLEKKRGIKLVRHYMAINDIGGLFEVQMMGQGMGSYEV